MQCEPKFYLTLFLRFTKTKWLSVPPETSSYPFAVKLCANLAQLLITCS
uniref:SHMT7 n=1 Tax=Arundo donax TaxID=35708 RepID=A0A0A9DX55_ARUDO